MVRHTSAEAWAAIASEADTLRAIAFRLIHESGSRGMSALEVVAASGRERWSIQPRISELAGNRESVARTMRKLFPSRALIVAADDDRHLSENIGLNAAQRAAESIGALLATPLPLGSETRSADSGIDFADIAPAEAAHRIKLALGGEGGNGSLG